MQTIAELNEDRKVVLEALEAAIETQDKTAETDMRGTLAALDAEIAALREKTNSEKPAAKKTTTTRKPAAKKTTSTPAKKVDDDDTLDYSELNDIVNDFEKWAKEEEEADRIIAAPVSRKKPTTSRTVFSWKKSVSIEQIKAVGFVFDMAVALGTCQQIAVELNQDVKCMVKGDATATAKKGELVVFVHIEDDNWRQFNIIENKNNCTLRLAKTDIAGKQDEVTPLAKTVAKAAKEKIKEKRAKVESMNDKIHKAIDIENKKGERKSDSNSFWGGKAKFMAVSKAVMILAENHKNGLISTQIVSIVRDADNRIIFEMAEPNADGKTFKEEKREYLQLNEQKMQMSNTSKPNKPYGLVDARKSELAQHGKVLEDYKPVSDSRYLDSIYSNRTVEAKECKQLERASRKCQAGNCPKGSEEAKELNDLERECTRHLDPYSKLMPLVQKAFKEFYKKGFTVYIANSRSKKMDSAAKFNAVASVEPTQPA
jgi:hypothetical protein